MEQHNNFHQLMKALWRCMEIEPPDSGQTEVYTVAFDNQVEVHFLNTHPGQVDIIAEAGILNNRQAGQPLLDLLALNHPPYNVNVDQDTGTVLVWTRQELEQIDCDKLVALLTQMMIRVQQAKVCIEYRQSRNILSPARPHHRTRPMMEGEKRTETGLRS